ncbi:MAG: 2,3,4,5-tetrahydropyridine-2,6-carboxylate N-succinyltransferase [Alphaproteobacteria bacterium]|nr:MAG: 2,3,4,5-tetrahydropyridine-2,6-carboxylate N-succinyltransferase [Alphaproteobacteria bacterium]
MVQASKLNIQTNASAMQMANAIFGDGVTIVNASYTGSGYSSGIFTGGNATSPGVVPSDSGVILSTGRASDFTNSKGNANQSGWTSTNSKGPNGDPDFNALAGTQTYDASFLEATFVPTGDTLTMQFVFSSEEYPEYINSIYNDVVGVWVNGQPAELSVGGTPSIGSVNTAVNQNLYVDNTGSQYNTEMDGFTVTMTLKMKVIPGQQNTIKIGIADVGDSVYDSNLLIAADSVQTAFIAGDDTVNVVPGGTKTVDVLANDGGNGATLTITHINGIPVVAGDTVTLTTGQQVTLNADGTFTVVADADTETVNFTYTVDDGQGHTDTAFVVVNSVPCFARGTRIETPEGLRPIETLSAGDLVVTRDGGPRPIRWIGSRQVSATGKFAPVRIEAGALGQHGTLWLSPQHRVKIGGALCELMFSSEEVLVPAIALVNGRTITIERDWETVEYWHILLDRHEVVLAEGLEVETLLPGPELRRSVDPDAAEEIFSLFPELRRASAPGWHAARPALRRTEAAALANRLLA